jgi:hypothetical protein
MSELAELVGELEAQARRARQPGKRPGLEGAARWLGGLEGRALARVLEDVAGATPEETRRRLEEAVEEVGT